jgi:hypothetical protein
MQDGKNAAGIIIHGDTAIQGQGNEIFYKI